ncbi:hypothetical protein AAFF_G00097910 [Aldrovandia affinis]|uniref:CCHC-type domain-containing protein n=1 Tax=Aldrovandia affinis TaxID=143900 RepID=A0AAD7RVD5_9TELE|nr:hypothetical protein AAFF_G00097910 [Aldrovandia affinis]
MCFRCGLKAHKARTCQRKQWCSQCKSTTHRDATCRRGPAAGRRATSFRGGEQQGVCILTSDRDAEIQSGRGVKMKGLMVDTGATSHIIKDIAKFKKFDDRFQAETHCVELADGTRSNGIAERRGERRCA